MRMGRWHFRDTLAVLMVGLLLSSSSPSAAQPAQVLDEPSPYALSSADLIVTFYLQPTAADEARMVGISGVQATRLSLYSYRVQIAPGSHTTANDSLQRLSRAGLFDVEHNRPLSAALQITDPDALWYTVSPTGLATHLETPGQSTLAAPTAFDVTQGSGVPIAVIDINPDYLSNPVSNPDLPTPTVRELRTLTSRTVEPWQFHDTQVASVIFSQNNNGIGKAGVCPRCVWHSYAAYTDIDPQGVTQAPLLATFLEYLEMVRTSSAKVVNMSWGDEQDSVPIEMATRALFDSGKILVAAAGNRASSRPLTPARLEHVVGVGAVDINRQTGATTIWAGSNGGVDIVAPGVLIPSPVVITPPQQAPETWYEQRTGTSYASPHVAGIFGLLISELEASPSRYPVTAALSPTDRRDYLIQLVKRSATDLGAPGPDHFFGHGLVNAYEAFRTMLSDNSSTLSTELQQGFIENSSRAGGAAHPFLPRMNAELASKAPTSQFEIQQSARHGECIVPGSYKFHEPTLTTQVANASVQVTGVHADTIDVVASAEIFFSLDQEISVAPSFALECVSGWRRHSFSVGWNGDTDSVRRAEITYRLGADGYRRERVIPSGPMTTRVFSYTFPRISGPGNASAQYAFFLERLVPSMTLVESALNADLVGMADAMVRATLTLDRLHTSSYARGRTVDNRSSEVVHLPSLTAFANGAQFSHFGSTSEAHSHFGIHTAHSVYQSGIIPAPALPAGGPVPAITNSHDASVATHENYYNSILQNLHARGVFSRAYNSELSFLVETGTRDSIDPIVIHAEASAVRPPSLRYQRAAVSIGQLGEILVDLSMPITILFPSGTEAFRGTLPMRYTIPFTTHDMYRSAPDEKNLAGNVGQYEERITLDFFAARAELMLSNVAAQDPLAPGVPLRVGELETFFAQTFGGVLARSLAALSGWETAGEKNLGTYGCVDDLALMLQRYSLSVNGTEALRLLRTRDCFDLDLGFWIPRQAPAHHFVDGHSVRALEYIRGDDVPEPVASFAGSPFVSTVSHPATVNSPAPVVASYVLSIVQSGTGEEVRSSHDGVFSSPFRGASGENLLMYEQLWQEPIVRQLSGGAAHLKWLPKRLDRGTGPYQVVSQPRHSTQLVLGDHCLPLLEVEFSYHSRVPPTVAQEYAQSFEEQSVFVPHDSWQKIDRRLCGAGSGSSQQSDVSILN